MTVRFSALAPINDPASLYKPIRKVVHRGHPEIQVTRGNHALVDSPFAPLRGWFPIECFHFPLRSEAQTAHKAELQGEAFEKHIARPPTAYHADMYAALRGRPDRRLLRGARRLRRRGRPRRAEGRLVVDTRLRDALRRLRDPASGGYLPPRARRSSLPAPDARRGRGVRRRGGGARRGRRRPAPAAAGRARAQAPDGRAAPAEAGVPEAPADGEAGPRRPGGLRVVGASTRRASSPRMQTITSYSRSRARSSSGERSDAARP